MDDLARLVGRARVEAPNRPALVRRRCSTRLARFEQPSRAAIAASLPRSVPGQVRRGRLRVPGRRRAVELLE